MAKKTAAKTKAKSKSKKKTGGAALPSRDQALAMKPSETLISKAKLNKLLDDDNRSKKEVDSEVGVIRESIKYAADHDHLHKGAYADLKRYDRMENEVLADRWVTLLDYMEKRGIFARINSVQRLPLNEAETETDSKETKAKPGPEFGGTVKKMAADAGASTTDE